LNPIFAKDPRGYQVGLSEKSWEHISTDHPDLDKNGIKRNNLKSAINNPLDGCIYESNKFVNSDLYYTQIGDYKILRVVVRYFDDVGEIVTAYFCHVDSYRGNIKWQRPKKSKRT